MDLSVDLKCLRKGLINIKNKMKNVRHVNLPKKHPERILKTDEKVGEKLDYNEIEFPVQEKDFNKIEVKNKICINVFGDENGLVFPTTASDQKFKDSMDLLLLIGNDRSHYETLFIKMFVLIINLLSQLLFIEVKMQLMNLLN